MAEQQLVVGARLVVSAEFRLDGVPEDPTVVRLFVRDPDGTLIELAYPSPELIRLSRGVYEGYVTTAHPGTYAFRMTGTGTVEAVQETTVSVAPSSVI